VRNRWKEYIEKLYNAEGKPHSLSVEPATDMDDIGPCILEEEVATAIQELKNNKAEGIDEIYTRRVAQMHGQYGGEGFHTFVPKNL